MIHFRVLASACLALSFISCSTSHKDLVLDPVGPAPVMATQPDDNGTLRVFTAYDVHPHFTSSFPRHRFYTNYRILTPDGKPLKTVHNDSGTVLEGPVDVALAPGKYRVVARAEGRGQVTVPVEIVARRLTSVDLESSASLTNVEQGRAAVK